MRRIHTFLKFSPVLFIISFLISAVQVSLVAQDDGPLRVYMYLNYYQKPDEVKILEAEMKYREKKVFQQIPNVEVSFYFNTDTSTVELGKATTNEEGKALFTIKDLSVVHKDTTGLAIFSAEFEATDKFKAASQEIEIKDVVLKMSLEVVDSVNMVLIEAEEVISGPEKTRPVNETDVLISVKRLYSDLIVGEGYIEDGAAEVEFPDDLPGDQNGNLIVRTNIEEHETYGYVEAQQEIDWGIPVSYELGEMPRALWSRAPVWMMIAIFAILLGAWYHFFLAMYKLRKMKKVK